VGNIRYNMSIDEQIEQNMGLIVAIVNKFCPRNDEERDAYIQAGRIGLWKAINKFLPAKGKLTTIAFESIKWEILKEIKFLNKHKNMRLSNVTEPIYDNPELLWEFFSDKLNPVELEVIKMRSEGYSLQQITNHLESKPSRVYKTYLNALRKLKKNNYETQKTSALYRGS
jgi:RNA polymerase sigma factor (sigma-70 family)